MRIMQNFSSFHIDKAVVGRNAISKNANNVVISRPRLFIFSHNIELVHSFRFIWSRDHNDFRFGRQGARNFFFQTRFSRQPLVRFPKFFQGRVPPDERYLSPEGHVGRGSNLGARPPKVKFLVFFCGTSPGAGGRNLSYGNHSNGRHL